MPAEPATARAIRLFKAWFWQPPRAHGEAILDRRVSPLELLYDLVFATVIAQAGNHLAAHVTAAGLVEFAAVFSLTWIAWANGSLYLELHGRLDGRTRSFFFVQIGILAILAVYAADAGGKSGADFAVAYAAFLAVMSWLWFAVRRRDALVRPEFLDDTARYLIALMVSIVIIVVSAFLPEEPRLGLWMAYAAGWAVLLWLIGGGPVGLGRGITPTDSLVERFGTITIIVLGAVFFGVVDGLSQSQRDFSTLATGLIALVIGFGLWWIYFDIVGGRLPKPEGRAIASWILSHYPITLAIAAAGAGMVSLIENAHQSATPAATAWLLSGAVAVGLLFLIPTWRALADAGRLSGIARSVWIAMLAGAAVSLAVGWLRPVPWLLALLLVAVLSSAWAVIVRGFALAGVWGTEG